VHEGEEPQPPFRIKADRRLSLELAYCVPIGIPHSVFLGWSDDDQDKALAWVSAEAEKCSRCRTTAAEWDPKQGGSRTAYVADESRCLGCEVLDMAARDLGDEQDTLGMKLGLVPNDEPDDDGDDPDGEDG